MSDLSRLRARWVRLENRIAKLEGEIAEAADYEIAEITEKKVVIAKASLKRTIELTVEEERRIASDPNSKLKFTGV